MGEMMAILNFKKPLEHFNCDIVFPWAHEPLDYFQELVYDLKPYDLECMI